MTGLWDIANDINNGIEIQSIEILKSSGFHDQYSNCFTTEADRTTVNRLAGTLADKMENSFDAGSALDFSTNEEALGFLRPRANVDRTRDRVSIAGGWEAERFSFIAHVICDQCEMSGFERELIVIGYTNYAGMTNITGFNPQLDEENMEFYINSVINISNSRERGPRSNRMVRTPRSFNTIIMSNPHDDRNRMDAAGLDDTVYSASPSVVARRLGIATRTGTTEVRATTADRYSRRSGRYESPYGFGDRRHANSGNYVGDLFHSMAKTTLNTAASGRSMNRADVLMDTSSSLAADSKSVANSGFMDKLTDDNHSDFRDKKSFTLSQLYSIDPGLEAEKDERISIYRCTDDTANGFRDYTTEFHGADAQTQAARMVRDSLPTILFRSRLAAIGFTAHLVYNLGEAEWLISTGTSLHDTEEHQGAGGILSSLEGVGRGNNLFGGEAEPMGPVPLFKDEEPTIREVKQSVETFKVLLIQLILDPITFNRQQDLTLNVQCDIKGSTVIQISTNGERMESFAVPTTMDALLSPALSRDNDAVNELTQDFMTILDSINEYTDTGEDDGYESIADQLDDVKPVTADKFSNFSV